MMKLKWVMIIALMMSSTVTLAALKRGEVQTTQGPFKVYYQPLEPGIGLYQGDILVHTLGNKKNKGVTRRRKSKLWKKGIVPFVIDPALPNASRITGAMAILSEVSGIEFVPKTDAHKDYIYFKHKEKVVCASYVGRAGGKQSVLLHPRCGRGVVIHEVMHALGFYHEQSRWDRNKHIKVKWFNISFPQWFNFFRAPFAKMHGQFDFNSIMLYSSFSFSRNKKPTIVKRDGSTFGTNRSRPSIGDVAAIAKLYEDEVSKR